MEKEYLGDGLYVTIENGMLKLTSENGVAVLNTVYLEMPVFKALVDYVQRITSEEASE